MTERIYTAAEMEAWRLLYGNRPLATGADLDAQIRSASEHIVALGARIQSERARTTLDLAHEAAAAQAHPEGPPPHA